MIRYTLKCAEDHEFESWFRDSEAFDKLVASGQIACGVCGDTRIVKTIMAPAVSGAKKKAEKGGTGALSGPASPAEAVLARLRRHLHENSDYVGREFADEARRIHDGEADERSIWGEASRDEARALKEDGIPVAPIPWISRRND